MTKSPTRESPPQRANNRNRAVGTLTITTANMSSPLRSIGPRQKRHHFREKRGCYELLCHRRLCDLACRPCSRARRHPCSYGYRPASAVRGLYRSPKCHISPLTFLSGSDKHASRCLITNSALSAIAYRAKPRDPKRMACSIDELTPPHVYHSSERHSLPVEIELCITAKFGGECPLWVKSRHGSAFF